MTSVDRYCASCTESMIVSAEFCPHCGVSQIPVPANMGPVKAYTSFLKNYFNFSGRASRSEYWWVVPINILLGFIPYVSLLLLIGGVALSVRRLHDTGKSGWLIFLAVIPVVGWIILVWWYLQKSDELSNNWGESPTVSTEKNIPSP